MQWGVGTHWRANMHAHACKHAHTCTHADAYAHIHAHAHMHMHAHTHTQVRTGLHPYASVCLCIGVPACTHTSLCVPSGTPMQACMLGDRLLPTVALQLRGSGTPMQACMLSNRLLPTVCAPRPQSSPLLLPQRHGAIREAARQAGGLPALHAKDAQDQLSKPCSYASRHTGKIRKQGASCSRSDAQQRVCEAR